MNKKRCSTCREAKSFKEFVSDRTRNDGLECRCKKCNKERKTADNRTKKGLVAKIYASQRCSSIDRKHPMPDYNLTQLREWAFIQPIFHKLHREWVASEYEKDLVPSFDRIKNNLPYTFSNLQIMTWYGNSKKAHEDQKNGIDNRRSKGVVGTNILTLETVEFPSQRMAARKLGINQSRISKCCLGKQKTTCGYKWEFKLN